MVRRTKTDWTTINIKLPILSKLLGDYSRIQREIIRLSDSGTAIFQTENIVGEYAELLACERLDLIQEPASNTDYDATDRYGNRYQIKARWLGNSSKPTGKNEFGSVKEETLNRIDYVIIILFNSNFTVNYAYKLDTATYKLNSYKKASGLTLKPSVSKLGQLDYRGCNITSQLKGDTTDE